MKKKVIIGIIASMILLAVTTRVKAQSYDKLWKDIASFEKKDMPKSIIECCNAIIKKAQSENNTGQLLKAYIYRMQCKESISEDSLYTSVKDLENRVLTTKSPVDNMVIHSILAGIYAGYASMNDYELDERTNVSGVKDADDMREWTHIQFNSAILRHVEASLSDISLLHATSTKKYLPFTSQNWASEYYKHDMLHLIARKAINSLNALSNSEVKRQKTDSIYQLMQNIYRSDKQEEAYVLVTLDKLNFQKSVSKINDKTYTASLNNLLNDVDKSKEIRSEIFLALANDAYSHGKMNKTLDLCNQAISLYPKYNRITSLQELRNRILNPSVSLSIINAAYPLSKEKIFVNHKNANGFTLRIYRIPDALITKDNIKAEDCKLLNEQHFNLTQPKNYIEKKDSFMITTPDVGVYLIETKVDGAAKNSNTQNAILHISRLMLLSMSNKGQHQFVVTDRTSGQLIEGATVIAYDHKNRVLQQGTTDNKGKVTMTVSSNSNQVKAVKGNDKYMDKQYLSNSYYYSSNDSTTQHILKLLTDRSIYRPGQIVHVKGIAYSQRGDNAKTIDSKSYQLSLRDANHQEIANKKVTTNGFGSFTVDFTLPSSCLNGNFSVTSQTDGSYAYFRVEEYKRPTFEVTTDDVKESYSLGDTVYIKGKAKTFSGVPVDGAMAKYTVKRSEWCWWRENGDEITTNDSVKLAPDGSFTIPVYLSKKNQTESDEEDEEKDEEDDVFTYYTFNTEIHVTTPAGETQNGNVTLAAGQRSLILSLSEKETICKDKPIKLTFEAKNLLQKPVDTNIDYSLVALKNGKETDVVDKGTVSANKEISLAQWQQLPSGRYIVHLTAKDSQNRTVDRKTNIILFSKNDVHPVENCNIWYYSDDENFDGQHPAKFYFGTSRKDATVLMDVFSNGTCIDSKILTLSDEIKSFEYPYKESYGNGLSINFCFVKDGTLYQKIITLKKSLPNNELKIKWSVFRDKLCPGQKEEWRLNILSPSNKPANAEMLALMYDASLNKIWERRNQQNLSLSYNRYIPEISWNSSYIERMRLWYNASLPNLIIKPFSFDNYLDNTYDSSRPFGRVFGVMGNDEVTDAALDESPVVVAYGVSKQRVMAESKSVRGQTSKIMVRGLAAPKLYANASIDMNQNDNANTVRTNFAETAFFYPQLRTDEKGNISIAFTLPESLTKWQFEGYAHTKDMMTGYLSGETVASKDFMLTPNLPRFVRVGDQTSVAATVSNMTEKQIQANVKFELFDPTTEQVIMTQNKPVSLGEKKSEAVTFSFLVTDRYDLLGVRMIADGGTFSDGEQHILPVLSDQVMLTESVPLPIRGNQTREFSLEKLFNRHSKTATNRKLTVEYTGNPAWYAVQALPSLAMPTNDNAISWASVLYANTLASYIANSTPRIKAVIDSWKLNGGTKETLLSNLHKNQELKNILLEESPWVLEAKSEQEQKERLGTLFDLNSLQNNSLAAINKLKQLQDEDGAWSWYKGMPGSRYITEYIVRLNARLQMLTKALPSKEVSEMQSKAINFLHQESQKEYEFILKAEKEGQKIHGISYPALRYLYLIAITGEKIPSIYSKEYNYFLSKVNEEPASQDMQEKSLAAIILDKAGKKSAAKDYIASIKEHLTKSDELGMYFDFTDNPFSWLGMHLSAHTAAIEAIDKVADDNTTVEEMKLWLLKQKQTQMWDTPVSTTDAIYALLERGTDILASSGNVSLSFANRTMQTSQKGSAGLGYIKQTFTDNTTTDARSINVAKKDNGIAWGAVYAQFQDKIANVKQEGSQSFNVKKDMFVKRIINNTAELQPIRENSTLKVGDIVVARLIIQLDRKMDFVQLKEQRGACFEPITNLSGYRWGAGTGYYEEIKDASTNFFFDSLEKGSYVLEINYRVSRTGDYEVGLSSLQCAYAPEFVTHSHSMRIKVEE